MTGVGSVPVLMLPAVLVNFAPSRPLAAVPSPAAAHVDDRRALERDEDAILVQRVIEGDRAAEEALYRKHGPSVQRLAMRLLRSRDEALDVLQDTFVSGYGKLASLRDPSQFRGWIHAVAARLVHRRFRRERLLDAIGLGRRSKEAIPLDELADEGASAEARAELRWLDQALQRIDKGAATAWMLRYIEGLQLEEVASACECSLATVKRRLAVAEHEVDLHFDEGAARDGGGASS